MTAAITRAEFSRLEARVEELKHEFSLQFSRIAQMQAELDRIRTAWAKRKAMPRVR